MRTGQAHRTLLGHSAPITCLQFDEMHVVSGSLDKTLNYRNLRRSSHSSRVAARSRLETSAEDVLAEGEDNYDYEHPSDGEPEDENDSDHDLSEDDLGPEDGEDAGLEDWEGDEGYAPM